MLAETLPLQRIRSSASPSDLAVATPNHFDLLLKSPEKEKELVWLLVLLREYSTVLIVEPPDQMTESPKDNICVTSDPCRIENKF